MLGRILVHPYNGKYRSYVDDFKVLVKKKTILETLFKTVKIYTNNIGMEFSIAKCIRLLIY